MASFDLESLRAEVTRLAAEHGLTYRLSLPDESPDDLDLYGVWLSDGTADEDLIGSGDSEGEALEDAIETIGGWSESCNQWLAGQRPPDRCRLCERALTCASPTCGAVLCEGDEELCAECETPRVTVLDAVETEYGLTLVEVRR